VDQRSNVGGVADAQMSLREPLRQDSHDFRGLRVQVIAAPSQLARAAFVISGMCSAVHAFVVGLSFVGEDLEEDREDGAVKVDLFPRDKEQGAIAFHGVTAVALLFVNNTFRAEARSKAQRGSMMGGGKLYNGDTPTLRRCISNTRDVRPTVCSRATPDFGQPSTLG